MSAGSLGRPSPGRSGVSRGGAESVAADPPCVQPVLCVLHVHSGFLVLSLMVVQEGRQREGALRRGNRPWTSPMFIPRLRTLITTAEVDKDSQALLLRNDVFSIRTMAFGLDLDELRKLLCDRVPVETCIWLQSQSARCGLGHQRGLTIPRRKPTPAGSTMSTTGKVASRAT